MISLFSKSKPQSVAAMESKLAEARSDADAAYQEMGAARLAIEEGNADGTKRLAKATESFDAATRRASELESALSAATARQTAQDKAAEALAQAEREKRLRELWRRIESCGPGVDAAVANLVESLKPLIEAQREAAALGAGQRMQDAIRDAAAWLQPVIAHNLRGMPGFHQTLVDAALLAKFSQRIPQYQDAFARRD